MTPGPLEPATAPSPGASSTATLRSGALGLGAVLMQGISHIAPAAGVVLSLQFLTQQAGAQAPLCFALAFLLVLPLGVSLTQLARALPSAGGYYSYLSRTVGPRAGFLTAWLYFLYDPISTAINLAYMGALLEQSLRAGWGLRLPWWVFLIVCASGIGLLSLRGVRGSTRALAALALGEIAIVLALCASGLLRPGPATPSPPPPPASGLYLGVVLSIFSFTGFESVVPLAEESAEPRRNLPRAILLSIALMGAFFVLASFALLRGWGLGNLAAFQRAPQDLDHPLFALARRLWGGAWVLLLLSLLNSVLAVSIACTNAATRVLYAMGRAGALPRALSRVHPQHQTPSVAIALQTAITLAVGLGLGAWLGPVDAFFFMGLAMTLGMVGVYSAGNLGVLRLYRGERRREWRPLLHAACPLISTVALLWVGVKSLWPLPAAPVGWAPYVTGGWLALGLLVLAAARLLGRERWLLDAGAAAFAREEAPQGGDAAG